MVKKMGGRGWGCPLFAGGGGFEGEGGEGEIVREGKAGAEEGGG